jgi:colicin import membrane protein
VHLALLAFLWIGVSWQSLTPTTVEAEIWDPIQRDAAPPPPEPEPVPEPPKSAPEPKPPAPVVAPEPPKVKTADPDIALEQEKKRKLQKEKLAEEKHQREEQERKQLAEEQKRQKEEQALKDKKKLEEDQKRKQEAAEAEEQKRKQEAAAAEEQKRKEEAAAEEKRKEEAAAEEKRKREKAAEKRRKASRAEAVDTLLSQVGDGEAGTAEKKSGAPGSVCELYIGKTVKSYTSFPDMPGNPVVTVRIRLTASRMLKEVKVVSASEYPEFDNQIERGIRKSGQFPAECPDDFTYAHFLKPR